MSTGSKIRKNLLILISIPLIAAAVSIDIFKIVAVVPTYFIVLFIEFIKYLKTGSFDFQFKAILHFLIVVTLLTIGGLFDVDVDRWWMN